MPAKNGPTSSSMTSLWSTTTAGEEPQGRVGGWAASFDRLLEDPLGLRYFMVNIVLVFYPYLVTGRLNAFS